MTALPENTGQNEPAQLTASAARALTEEVKTDAAALWSKLLTLYKGNAHITLGYSSWGEYYEAEFGESKSQGYRLLDSARVLTALPESRSPIGESVARELVPVMRKASERVEEVWAEALEEHGEHPTAAQVRETVERRRAPRPEPTVDDVLRTELIHWFGQGRVIQRLLKDRDGFSPLSRDLRGDVDLMIGIADFIKEELFK